MTDYNLGTARGRIEIDSSGAEAGSRRANAAVQSTGRSLTDLAPKATKAGAVLTGAAGLVAAGFGVAIKSAADFEKQISGIAAVSGATKPELDAIRAKALQLGKDTQFSASEAAQAIEELVKAGIPVKDVLTGAADGAVALAAAGGIQIPEAATLAANAMNAFGISAKDLGGVVDHIAGAANASAIDVGEFGQSLQQVGAVAHLAGLSFDDTSVAIAELGNAGIKGSDAGTSLKTFFQNLIPQTQQQFDLFEQLGLQTVNVGNGFQFLASQGIKVKNSQSGVIVGLEDLAKKMLGPKATSAQLAKQYNELAQRSGFLSNKFFDAQGKTKKLADLQETLKTALKGMSKEQELAALQTIFGSDAIRAAAVLADNGAAGYNKLSAAIDKTSAADVAAKRMDNLSGKFEQFKGSLETAGIVIGTTLLPALKAITDFVTNLLNKFLELSPGTQKLILIFVGVAAAVVGFIGVLLLIAGAIGTVITALAPLAAAIGIGVGALAGFIVVIPLIIAAVVILAIIIYKNFNSIKAFFVTVLTAIKNFFVSIWNSIFAFVKGIVVAVFGFVMTVVKAYIAVWVALLTIYITVITFVFTLIYNVVKAIILAVFNVIVTTIKAIFAVWSAIWNLFGPLIVAVFNLIVAVIRLALTIVAVVVLQSLLFVFNIFKSIFGAIKGFVTAVLNYLIALFTRAFNFYKAIVVAVLSFLQPYITTAFNFIKNIITTVLNAVSAVVSRIWGNIKSIISSAVGTIKTVIAGLSVIVGVVTGFFTNMYNGVVGKIRDLIGVVSGIGGRVLGGIGNFASLLYNKGREIIQGLIDGITSKVKAVTDAIGGITKTISKYIPGSPVKLGALRVLNNGYAGKQIVKMVTEGITAQVPDLQAKLTGVTDNLAPALVPGTASVIPLPRVPSQATAPAGNHYEVNVNNYNPVAEKSSVTTTKTMTRLALLEVV